MYIQKRLITFIKDKIQKLYITNYFKSKKNSYNIIIKNNGFECNDFINQLLYSLCEYGVIIKLYNDVISGIKDINDLTADERNNFNEMKINIMELYIIFCQNNCQTNK